MDAWRTAEEIPTRKRSPLLLATTTIILTGPCLRLKDDLDLISWRRANVELMFRAVLRMPVRFGELFFFSVPLYLLPGLS